MNQKKHRVHTTNFFTTFIEVAEDCPIASAEIPPLRGETKSVANLQFDLISKSPFRLTSDDVIFQVLAIRQGIGEADHSAERARLFSKGQPCLRSSPLAKRYGWGIASNAEGRVALVPVESDEYQQLATSPETRHLKAMRSKRA